jgi:membrane-associated protein
MDILHYIISMVMHLDQHLVNLVNYFGLWTYAILFLIIFCETAFIVTAFLPGDSLLFASGALAASTNALDVTLLFFLLVVASVTGNGINYMIGKFLGPKVFHSPDSWLLNKKHITKAHNFYKKYGGKAIIIARFMPIIRSFAPFIAGIGYMKYSRFFFFNLIGALLWIGGILYTSYLFGNLPFIKQHFSTIILLIIAISLIVPLLEIIRQNSSKATPTS